MVSTVNLGIKRLRVGEGESIQKIYASVYISETKRANVIAIHSNSGFELSQKTGLGQMLSFVCTCDRYIDMYIDVDFTLYAMSKVVAECHSGSIDQLQGLRRTQEKVQRGSQLLRKLIGQAQAEARSLLLLLLERRRKRKGVRSPNCDVVVLLYCSVVTGMLSQQKKRTDAPKYIDRARKGSRHWWRQLQDAA